MTDAWKLAVQARLSEMGKTRVWLAKEVGARKSAITTMLGPRQRVSGLVDAVSSVLGIEPPTIGLPEGLIEEAVQIIKELSDEDQEHVITLLRRLRK